MTLVGPQGQQLGGITDMEHQLMMQQQRQAEAINMHFSTALQLFSRWALPGDDEATITDKVNAATKAAGQFIRAYGYNIQLKSQVPDTKELDGKEPTGKGYADQD